MTEPKTNPIRGALAGLAAGLAASLAMNLFQKAWQAAMPDPHDDGDPATVKAADRLSRAVTGRGLAEDAKQAAGNAVHYGTGAALGLAYGLAAEYRPAVTAGFGTAFGAASSLVLDDIAVPAVGLGKPAWETPAATNANGILAHLVFGAVAEGTRRGVRASAL